MERSWEETRTAIELAVKETPPGIWIFGAFGGHDVLNEQVTLFELDHLASNHPVWLSPWNGHAYILNSKAMRLLQIVEEEPEAATVDQRVSECRTLMSSSKIR